MVAVVTPNNLGSEFAVGTVTPSKITVVVATGTVAGKVALATAAEGDQPTNDVDAATPAYVELQTGQAVVAAQANANVLLTDAFAVDIGHLYP